MSYREESQALEEPIDKILEGFEEFESAARKRLESGEWKTSHLEELNKIRGQMNKLDLRLRTMKNDTW